MTQILLSFGCGLAFAMGVTSWFYIRELATAKGRAEIQKEIYEHGKRVEDRLAVQVSAMCECLKEIKKRNGGAKQTTIDALHHAIAAAEEVKEP